MAGHGCLPHAGEGSLALQVLPGLDPVFRLVHLQEPGAPHPDRQPGLAVPECHLHGERGEVCYGELGLQG